MFKRKESKPKVRILFVEKKNDYASQLAEYFANLFYGELYEVYSAGPEHDIVDCEMISSVYSSGEDLRRQISKDFKDRDFLREDEEYDIVVYLDRPTYDEWSSRTPWQGKQMFVEVPQREDFKATDDLELFNEYIGAMNVIRDWVKENLKDPEALVGRGS